MSLSRPLPELHDVGVPSESGGRPPLVAVVCRAPVVSEAVAWGLESIAEVRRFAAGLGDTAGLLRSLYPDAVVVDDEAEAAEATAFANESGSLLLHISLRDGRVRALRHEIWEDVGDSTASAETVRNVIVGEIFGRRRGGPVELEGSSGP
jgi:hypothetical protein